MKKATREGAGVEMSIACEQKQEMTRTIKPPSKKWRVHRALLWQTLGSRESSRLARVISQAGVVPEGLWILTRWSRWFGLENCGHKW